MFSKALFKQSCKANGTMWAIITFAVCFMLSCVMLISGSGSIGEVKDSIQDTIIVKEIDSQLEKRAINYYTNANDGFKEFDTHFAKNSKDNLSYLIWLGNMPKQEDFAGDSSAYLTAVGAWKSAEPEMTTNSGKAFKKDVEDWQNQMPKQSNFDSVEAYQKAMLDWNSKTPASQEKAVAVAYKYSIDEVEEYVYAKALSISKDNTKDSAYTKELLGSVLYTINPNGTFNEFYLKNETSAPEAYDFMSILAHIQTGDALEYVSSEERVEYRAERAENLSSMFLAGNMVEESNVNNIVDQLSSFGVTKEKYDKFGYNYENLKHLSVTSVITYRNRLDYELGLLKQKFENGGFTSVEEYNKAQVEKTNELASELSSSLLSSLPSAVSEALEEIGKADLYTLIVGSIFYKLAGLLLPIIYMIMVSNNLIANQVDRGSMAYILSTSTKRNTVVFTQAVYLIGSLFAMFCLTTITGCICLGIVGSDVTLTYGNLILLNIGAFLVLFALSGLCFFTSCYFDRSKRSMAIGGGLSIFALVAAMLGLFGSPVIPSVVRLDSLNYFNYTTIISLFDVVSIMEGTKTFLWKFAILFVCGIAGYIAGSVKFIKKDLPL